jgi:hypothetical protein
VKKSKSVDGHPYISEKKKKKKKTIKGYVMHSMIQKCNCSLQEIPLAPHIIFKAIISVQISDAIFFLIICLNSLS